jgi:hypothetical protein
MDPDTLLSVILNSTDPATVREAAEALEEWLAAGGFPPFGWSVTNALSLAARTASALAAA